MPNVNIGKMPVDDKTVGVDIVVNHEDTWGGRGIQTVGRLNDEPVRVDDPGIADVGLLIEKFLTGEIAPKF